MKILSALYLFIKNLCLSEAVKLFECALFWKKPWWWKLNYYMSALYFLDTRYRIVLRERKKAGSYSLNNYTPGETSLITIMRIFQVTGSGETLPFIDLGSGRGYAVCGASLLYHCPTVGVEILQGYVSKCEVMREKLALENMEIHTGDMLMLPLNRKGIYFCTATAFDRALIASMEKRLEEVPQGSWVIMVHYPFTSPHWEGSFKGVEELPFTWGWDSVYFYRVD